MCGFSPALLNLSTASHAAGLGALQALVAPPVPAAAGTTEGPAAAGTTTPEAKAAKNRAPDQAALRAGAAAMGGSSTMLTGPGGVAPSLLSVGKNSLLGA